MTVTATLRQEKKVLIDEFLAVSTITGASPSGYFPLFVLSENQGISVSERFDRVATLNDVSNLVENTLTRFESKAGGIFTGVTTAHKLTILSAPTRWFDTFFTQAIFDIAAVSGGFDRIDIVSALPFPTTLDDVDWEVRDFLNNLIASGTADAQCIRDDLAVTTFKRRHLNLVFPDVTSATNHVNSVNTFVEDVIRDANVATDAFTGIETDVFT
jgi:hypothetical protein